MANTISRTISDDQLNRIVQIESAGNPNAKAPTSSAAGLGQFITGTWLGVVQKHKPGLFRTNTREQIIAMRLGTATAALQLEMLARFTEDNAAMLGAGFTDGDLYLAHFLGISDARKLFRAPSSDLASNHVTAGAVAANRSILAGKTCGQVRAWAQASMLNRWVKAGKPDWVKKWSGVQIAPPPDVPPVNVPAPKPAQPPLTKKQTGIMAAISAAIITVGVYVESHPFIVGGSVVAVILAFIAWRVLRK